SQRLSVRKRHGQSQLARSREPSDPCRGWCRDGTEGRQASQVRQGSAAGQHSPDAARPRRRPAGFVRRQQRQGRRPLRSRRALSHVRGTHMHRRRIGGLLLLVLGLSGAALAAEHPTLADAVEQRDPARVRTLLQKGVDVNAAQVDGTTALHWAAYHDDAETAGLLLRAGAHVNAVNRYGLPPLAVACSNGSGDVAKLLLAAGADANATMKSGETVLMLAARSGSLEA